MRDELQNVLTAAPPMRPRLLRTGPAARYLGLSPWALRNLIHEGQIPVVQEGEGKPFLLDMRDLDQWIENSKRFRPSL